MALAPHDTETNRTADIPADVPAEYRPLPAHLRADRVMSPGQWIFAICATVALVTLVVVRLFMGRGPTLMNDVLVVVGVITVLNFTIIAYKCLLLGRALGYQPVSTPEAELRKTPQGGWPFLNVLVPIFLMHEADPAALITAMVRRVGALEYPHHRMRVLVAVEEKDHKSRRALAGMKLPGYFRVVVCPKRKPMGKPGACNYALLASGKPRGVSVIFDIEDIPETDQAQKAAHRFAELPPSVVCLQAQLQYYNVGTNLLTKLFSSEYAMHFALMLVGLSRTGSPMPLGGTSNYFRTEALLALGCWDMYNVTEDMDLGVRIARRGWRVDMLDSVTLEEANSKISNYITQVSRWKKGAVQTWLVHMRNPWRLWRELGTSGFVSFQLTIGFATFTAVINPALWALTLLYFYSRGAGWTEITTGIESLFPAAVFYLGLASMVIGNLLVVYFHLAGCVERRLHVAVLALAALPLYWVLMFVATCKGVGELFLPWLRHTWARTKHGLDTAPDDQHTVPAAPVLEESRVS